MYRTGNKQIRKPRKSGKLPSSRDYNRCVISWNNYDNYQPV